MKKLVSLLIIATLVAGVSFAQGIQDERDRANVPQSNPTPRVERQRTPQQQRIPQQRTPQQQQQHEPETVKVSGTLKLEKGFVAVQSGDKTYLIPMLNRYIGFINGLQEGKTVSIEGFAGRSILHPKKLTIDGKEYDFGRASFTGTQHVPNRYHPHQKFYMQRKHEKHPRTDRLHGDSQPQKRRGIEQKNERQPNRENRTHNEQRRSTPNTSATEHL